MVWAVQTVQADLNLTSRAGSVLVQQPARIAWPRSAEGLETQRSAELPPPPPTPPPSNPVLLPRAQTCRVNIAPDGRMRSAAVIFGREGVTLEQLVPASMSFGTIDPSITDRLKIEGQPND